MFFCVFVEVLHHFPINFKRGKRKAVPELRVTLAAEPTLATVYEEKLTTLPESTVPVHAVFA